MFVEEEFDSHKIIGITLTNGEKQSENTLHQTSEVVGVL